jgi:peptide/nickel transport system permease protein
MADTNADSRAPHAGRLKRLWGELWRDKAGFSVAMIAALILMAAAAPLIARIPRQHRICGAACPPVWEATGSWKHILGTDHLGAMCCRG